ncbi:MAG TPA: hypothetical protein VGL99_17485 [Chloroflexota bacterium]|jgi:hypothetical protein
MTATPSTQLNLEADELERDRVAFRPEANRAESVNLAYLAGGLSSAVGYTAQQRPFVQEALNWHCLRLRVYLAN